MYIEDRLFSETSDEVLYSVTMTEEEYNLFSEFQKEFTSIRLRKKQLELAGEAAAKEDIKAFGRIRSTLARHGGYRKVLSNGPDSEKVVKGLVNHFRKTL